MGKKTDEKKYRSSEELAQVIIFSSCGPTGLLKSNGI